VAGAQHANAGETIAAIGAQQPVRFSSRCRSRLTAGTWPSAWPIAPTTAPRTASAAGARR